MKQTLLRRLTNQPAALDHLLVSLTDDQIRQRPQSGKWSIFENLAHLGLYQNVFLERLQRILVDDTLIFNRYVADDDPSFIEWTLWTYHALIEQRLSGRAMLNAFLSGLQQEQLNRVGLHPAYGPMTIEGWTEFFLLHEAHHFFTILKLGGELRNNDQPMGL